MFKLLFKLKKLKPYLADGKHSMVQPEILQEKGKSYRFFLILPSRKNCRRLKAFGNLQTEKGLLMILERNQVQEQRERAKSKSIKFVWHKLRIKRCRTSFCGNPIRTVRLCDGG